MPSTETYSMKSASSAIADPRLIEQFLLSLDEIEDASVWFDGEHVRAQVIASYGSQWNELKILESCQRALGQRHVPTKAIVVSGRGRAVVHMSPR